MSEGRQHHSFAHASLSLLHDEMRKVWPDGALPKNAIIALDYVIQIQDALTVATLDDIVKKFKATVSDGLLDARGIEAIKQVGRQKRHELSEGQP